MGLSYQFDLKAHVLEKLNIEELAKKSAAAKQFKEYKELQDGETIVTIEHW